MKQSEIQVGKKYRSRTGLVWMVEEIGEFDFEPTVWMRLYSRKSEPISIRNVITLKSFAAMAKEEVKG